MVKAAKQLLTLNKKPRAVKHAVECSFPHSYSMHTARLQAKGGKNGYLQDVVPATTTNGFLAKVLPHSGIYMLFLIKGKAKFHKSYTSIDAMASAVEWFERSGHTVYHACGAFHTETSRQAENAAQFRSFFLDLDCGLSKS